jgi:hypothetical protein
MTKLRTISTSILVSDPPTCTYWSCAFVLAEPRSPNHIFSLFFFFAAYDPSNLQYRKVSSFFWDHYSQELDSWRDQPLWSYCIHHFNVTPLVFTTEGIIIFGGDFFEQNHKQMGFGGHKYDEKADNDAAAASSNRLLG